MFLFKPYILKAHYITLVTRSRKKSSTVDLSLLSFSVRVIKNTLRIDSAVNTIPLFVFIRSPQYSMSEVTLLANIVFYFNTIFNQNLVYKNQHEGLWNRIRIFSNHLICLAGMIYWLFEIWNTQGNENKCDFRDWTNPTMGLRWFG